MVGKKIRCLPNPSQHLPMYIQQFASYWNRKCKKSSFSRTAAHIFVCRGNAPGAIMLNVVWMERQLDAYKLCGCMYLSNYNGFWILVKLIKRDALCQRQLRVLVAVRKLLAAINAREKLRAYINPHTLLLIAAAADEYTRSEYKQMRVSGVDGRRFLYSSLFTIKVVEYNKKNTLTNKLN